MNAEFNWWLLIVGMVIGAGLVYLVLADSSRREADLLAEEVPREATWIAASLTAEGRPVDPATAERVLELHRTYLAAPPPDDEEPEAEPPAQAERAARPARTPAPEASTPAPGSVLRDDPHVQRDAAEPQPPNRDVHQPR